ETEPAAPLPALTRLQWLLLIVLAAVQFTHIVDFMIVMPLGPLLEKAPEQHGFGLNHEQFSYIVAAYAVSAAIAGLLAAFFMDRFDRKRLLSCLYTGFVFGTGLCALAPNYPMLLLGRVVAGAFGGVGASATLVIVGDRFAEARRGTAMGVLMSAFSVASIVGVPVGLLVADVFVYWQAPFAALAGLGVLILVLMQVVLPPLPRPAGAAPVGFWSILARYRTVLVHPGHLVAYLFMMVLVLGSFTVGAFTPDFLVKNVGMDNWALILVYVCGGAATLWTLTWFGRMSDRFGKPLMFRVLAALTVAPLVLVTNLPAGLALPLVLGATTLMFILTSGRMVPAMALITACAEPHQRGSFMSINSAVQQLALGLAAVIGGAMMGETATKALTGYATVGWFSVGMTLLSVLMIGLLRPASSGGAAVAVETPVVEPEAAPVAEVATAPAD
ncbi:MAG TPA: MFS transporter, partial [Gemmataceae bacterium]|nr:MFS transporter [Gemmataceae bacterium]